MDKEEPLLGNLSSCNNGTLQNYLMYRYGFPSLYFMHPPSTGPRLFPIGNSHGRLLAPFSHLLDIPTGPVHVDIAPPRSDSSLSLPWEPSSDESEQELSEDDSNENPLSVSSETMPPMERSIEVDDNDEAFTDAKNITTEEPESKPIISNDMIVSMYMETPKRQETPKQESPKQDSIKEDWVLLEDT